MERNCYTLKEMKLLFYLHKHPCDYVELMRVLKLKDKRAIDQLLSGIYDLHICEPEEQYLAKGSTISLTDLGETVVRAEKERRFDVFFTRAVALVALVVSIVALIAG